MSKVVQPAFHDSSATGLVSSTGAVDDSTTTMEVPDQNAEGLGVFDSIRESGNLPGNESFPGGSMPLSPETIVDGFDGDVLGIDLEDNDLNHKVKNELFTRIDYTTRNYIPERVTHVSEAKDLAKDLYGVNLREWQAGIQGSR